MPLLKKIVLLCNKNVRYYSIKRKLPPDPAYIKELPVFQYGTSSHNKRRVYVWGNAETGALGTTKYKKQDVSYLQNPKRLSFAEQNHVVSVACGFGFTAFAVKTKDGNKIYGSGLNRDSQIGHHAASKDKYLEILYMPQEIYIPFANAENVKILKMNAGRAHLAILTSEGLYTLGNNAYGQCCRKIITDEDYGGSKYVHHIPDLNGEKIVDVTCGQDHTIALTETGSVYSCGWGADGQTGLAHFNTESKLTKLSGALENERIVKVSCASDFALAINDRGEVFGWGNNEYSQMDLPENTQQVATPMPISMCKGLGNIIDVAAGGCFCLILNEEGSVYTWGYGLLGVGPEIQTAKTPVKIPSQLFGLNDFNPYVKVEKIACGLGHMAAVTNHGDLFTWGRNRECCLGLGNNKDQYFPLKVSLGSVVIDVMCGLDHTIAICKSFI